MTNKVINIWGFEYAEEEVNEIRLRGFTYDAEGNTQPVEEVVHMPKHRTTRTELPTCIGCDKCRCSQKK